MTGFTTRARDAITRSTNSWADVSIVERGLSVFLDPTMAGSRRFMQVLGFPHGTLTPQMSDVLSTAATAGAFRFIVKTTSLQNWLVPDMKVTLEQQEVLTVRSVTPLQDGTLAVDVTTSIQGSHNAGALVTVDRFPATVYTDIVAGAGAPQRETVRFSCPFVLVPGDTIVVAGTALTIDRVSDVGANLYDVGVSSFAGLPDVLQGTVCYVEARPVYRSAILATPDNKIGALARGPYVVDAVASPMMTETFFDSTIRLFIEEYDTASKVISPFREVQRNQTLVRHPITTDQMLFWNTLEGTVDWNGSKTVLRAQNDGRVHIWTPCRPVLDAAPPVRGSFTVPLFAPYRVLLNSDIVEEMEVRRVVDNQIIPSTEYVVDTATGNVDFNAVHAGTATFITFRPRISWQTTVTPSEDGLVLSVIMGRQERVLIPLGAAGVQQVITLAVTEETAIDQVHIGAFRSNNGAGPFSLTIGDLTPRGRRCAALRYVVSTSAVVDYDWASSGLLLKPLWHNLDLLRSRLDDDSALSNFLDNGRLVL